MTRNTHAENGFEQMGLFGDPPEAASAVKMPKFGKDEAMKISLNIKKPSEFFWVRRIRAVDISECCAKCFIGDSDTRLYHATSKGQTPRKIELDLTVGRNYIAYYLCGLAKRFYYPDNTHVAFVYAPGETLELSTSQIDLTITDARYIDFSGYVPNPQGYYNDYQRKCRNWIFANYIRDGLINR